MHFLTGGLEQVGNRSYGLAVTSRGTKNFKFSNKLIKQFPFQTLCVYLFNSFKVTYEKFFCENPRRISNFMDSLYEKFIEKHIFT